MQGNLSRFSPSLGTLAVLALAGMATVSSQPTLAQTGAAPPVPGSPSHACNLLTSAEDVPDGFGAAYNLFSADKELLLGVECGSSSNATLTVGNGQSTTYVYRFAYEWVNGGWKQLLLGGSELVGNDWYVGDAKTDLVRSQAELGGDNFVVAYTCLSQNNTWKCGCRDATCMQNYWQMQAFKQEPPSSGAGSGGGAVGSGNSIPSAARTVNVSNGSQLSSAITNAQAGDHIVLQDGSFGGFTISRSGTSAKPIVIRAAKLHGAKFSGQITINGDHVWVVGMHMGGNGIVANGTRDRISRNYFKASIGPAIYAGKPSRNVEIDHNEHAGGTITSTSNNGASPIFMEFQCAEPSDHYVHHNYIHDGTGGDGTSEAIMNGFGVVCDSTTKRSPDSGTLIEYNLISNWRAGYCLRTKSGKATFRFNTCLGGKGSQNRKGDNVQWIANWFEGNGNIRLFGSNHVVLGNRMSGTNDVLWIPAGNIYSTDDFETGYHAALNTVVAGNIGELQIGGHVGSYDNAPAKNTRVEAHQTGNRCGQGSITCLKHTATTFSATTNRTIPEAIKLAPSQVGPNAPTAPK